MSIRRASARTSVNSTTSAAVAATPNMIIIAPATATTVVGGRTIGGGTDVLITNLYVTDSDYTVLDDQAISTSGGYVKIIGTGFKSGAIVYAGGTAALTTTFVSSTEIRAQLGAASSNTLHIYVVNPDDSGAIFLSGIVYSGIPVWDTDEALPGKVADTFFSIQLAATSDSSVTYAATAGSILPPGITVAADGALSGTVTGITDTTIYSFSVDAIDAENQETARTFTITIAFGDEYYRNTVLHLSGDTVNDTGENNNTFIDSSNASNFVTRTGNVTQGTFSPHAANGWSAYFDGTDDHITFPNSGNFAFGTGAFTIEFWINAPLNNDKFILGGRGAVGTMHITTGGSGSTAGVLRYVGSSTIVSSNIINDDNWHHCAIVRDGSSNITLYVDGVSRGTGTDSTNYTTTSGNWIVGRNDSAASNYLTGYISNLRVVKGTAVYTEAFTPSKVPLTAITGTSLLMSQSNNFRDNSSNNVTLTVNSGTAIQPAGPFRALNSWTPTGVGGSAYFDGTSDYLSVSNVDTNFGTSSNFTIDFWIYPTVINSAVKAIIDPRTSDASAHPSVWINASNRLYYFTTNAARITGTTTLTANQWYHVALVRNNGTTTLYLNGAVEGTPWADTVDYITATNFRIGQRYTSTAFNYAGYMHNLRIVKDTAVYTEAFTPPIAPTTAISGTTLLLNGTNGGIIDYTGKNNLETIGDVQIRNDVVKYGDSAMYFSRDSNQVGGYLSIPSSPNLGFGTGPFTIEFWMNTDSVAEGGAGSLNKTIMVTPGYGSTPFLFQHYGPALRFWSPGLSTSYIEYGSLTANTWHHVAVTRSGTTLRLFVNGVQRASRTDSSNYIIQGLYIGAAANGADGYLGYLDDIRITKGVARYTSNFDVPAATFLTR